MALDAFMSFRSDPATWSDEQWPPTFKGIINVLEVAHQEFVWRVRSHPKVVQVGSFVVH